MQCSYARLCDRINRCFLSASNTSPGEAGSVLAADLELWYRSIPAGLKPDDGSVAMTSQTRQLAVYVLYQYLEAYLAILDLPGVPTSSLPALFPADNRKCLPPVLSVVREIFVASSKIEDCYYYRYVNLGRHHPVERC